MLMMMCMLPVIRLNQRVLMMLMMMLMLPLIRLNQRVLRMLMMMCMLPLIRLNQRVLMMLMMMFTRIKETEERRKQTPKMERISSTKGRKKVIF